MHFLFFRSCLSRRKITWGREQVLVWLLCFVLGVGCLADFYFPHSLLADFHHLCFWPSVVSLFFLLIFRKVSFRMSWSTYSFALLAVVIAGLCLRCYKINFYPLYFDEADTTLRSVLLLMSGDHVSYAGLPIALFNGKKASLFTAIVKLFHYGIRDPVLLVRLPVAILGGATIWLMYRFVKEWSDRKTALFSALLLAFFPWHVIQSRIGIDIILTPLGGLLVFFLFSKAVKKGRVGYLYLSSFALGWVAFWTYTESQIYVAIYLFCFIFFRKRFRLRLRDILICICLFLVPLYPLLSSYKQLDFIRNQYYYSYFTLSSDQHISFIQNALIRWKQAFHLLFYAQRPFYFAPEMQGRIIHPFMLVPMFFGLIAMMRRNKRFALLCITWLLAGFVLAISFLKRNIPDRYLILIAPLFPILIASGVSWEGKMAGVFKKGFRLFIIAAACAGSFVYVLSFSQLNKATELRTFRRYSFGSAEISKFLSEQQSFQSPQAKAVLDFFLVPSAFYYIMEKKGLNLEDRAPLSKFIGYFNGELPEMPHPAFYCLWAPGSEAGTDPDIWLRWYHRFKQRYPDSKPVKIIYFPTGEKAIEIYRL
jgi:4-amino-4-deoxy-L-arabinose transferase-like glycosyltransferase